MSLESDHLVRRSLTGTHPPASGRPQREHVYRL